MEHKHRSVTEVEFIAGHFRCLGEKGASFYFRSQDYDEAKQQALLQQGDEQGNPASIAICRGRSGLFTSRLIPCLLPGFPGAAKFSSESDYATEMRDNMKRRVQPHTETQHPDVLKTQPSILNCLPNPTPPPTAAVHTR